jgi:hypothetical protein
LAPGRLLDGSWKIFEKLLVGLWKDPERLLDGSHRAPERVLISSLGSWNAFRWLLADF